jgi:hypothetical protein
MGRFCQRRQAKADRCNKRHGSEFRFMAMHNLFLLRDKA